MDTDTLRPEHADFAALKPAHRSSKHSPAPSNPSAPCTPTTRPSAPSISAHTASQSEPSLTDGDNALSHKMPTSVATPAPPPTTTIISSPKSKPPRPSAQPQSKKVKSTTATSKSHTTGKRPAVIKSPPTVVQSAPTPPAASTPNDIGKSALKQSPKPVEPVEQVRSDNTDNNHRSICRIPPRLLPSWLPPSVLYWSDDDDDDDADFYRYVYLRRKTDAEMEAYAISPAPMQTSGKQKTGNHINQDKQGMQAALSSTLAPPAATTRSRDAAARRVTDPPVQVNSRDRAAVHQNQHSSHIKQVPAVSTRKRSRAAMQLDSVRSQDDNGRKSSPGSHARNAQYTTNGHVSGKSGHMRSDADSRQTTAPGTSTPSHKKARYGHGSGGRTHASRDQFDKHETRKGWLVCKKCRASVWPPNIGKHDSTCPGQ